jgi:hypothetical protein
MAGEEVEELCAHWRQGRSRRLRPAHQHAREVGGIEVGGVPLRRCASLARLCALDVRTVDEGA